MTKFLTDLPMESKGDVRAIFRPPFSAQFKKL